jgi:CRISPR system Cascade subunit CasE
MHAFAEESIEEGVKAREKFGVLFRADVDDQRNRVIVYVQSSVWPDWSFLDTRRDYLLADTDLPNPACKDIAGIYQSLQKGQVLSFRLRANPTKRIPKDKKSDDILKGKRVGLLREEEQMAWLIRKGREREKGKPGGFEILMKDVEGPDGETRQVPRITVQCEGNQRGRKKKQGRSHEMTHLAVRFDGLLRITDASAFRETLARGVGSAKAYGFGLLSVAPVHPSPPSEAI